MSKVSTALVKPSLTRPSLFRFSEIWSYFKGALKEEYNDFFKKYHPHYESNGYIITLDDIAIEHPSVTLSLPEASTDRNIIPIAKLNQNNSPKPYTFMFTGMIHGNEFISGEVCLGILEKLVEESPPLLEQAEIYFLPVLNPDAFIKNVEKINKGKRFGPLQRRNANYVDLNRNFDDHFSERSWWNKKGWWEEFAGPYAFSETESRFIRDFVEDKQLSGAINFHSWSKAIIHPPYSTIQHDEEMEELAQQMSDAMDVPYSIHQGSEFYVNRLSSLLFRGAGELATIIRHRTVEGSLDGWLYKQGIPSMIMEISEPNSLPLAQLSTLYASNPPPSTIPFHVNNCYKAAERFMLEIMGKK